MMKITMINRAPALSLCAAALLALNGCTAAVLGGAYAANKYYHDNQTDFSAQNYAVADYLYQQAETFVKPKHLIAAQPLTDLESPEVASKIGSVIPEQIGVRLSQLGYKMDLSEVSTSADTKLISPTLNGKKPDFVLTGNYMRDGRDMEVKARIIDLHNKRIVATFDYNTRLIGDAGRLSKPITKIERISE